MQAAVQVPAYKEPDLGETLEAIADQPVPSGWDVDYEVFVTPSSPCCCHTAMQAQADDTFDAYEAGRGKLTARNAAHEHAVDEGYDAIVSWDADAPPISDGTLTALLEPLEGEAVAVNATPVSSVPDGLANITLGTLVDLVGYFEDAVRPHMHGQCSSLTAEAWLHAGPFDESLDQTDAFTVRAEEEVDFYHRVSEVGPVVGHPEARVYNDLRRHVCNLIGYKLVDDGYCERRGVETFLAERFENWRR